MATLLLLVLQAADWVTSFWLPSVYLATAVNCCVLPGPTVALLGLTLTAVTFGPPCTGLLPEIPWHPASPNSKRHAELRYTHPRNAASLLFTANSKSLKFFEFLL